MGSVLCQHMAFGGLALGHGVAYFTSHGTVKELTVGMGALGMGVSNFLGLEKLRVVPLEPWRVELGAEQYREFLTGQIEKLPEGFEVVVVDGVMGLLAAGRSDDGLRFLSLYRELCDAGRTVVLSADGEGIEAPVLDQLGDRCDMHVSLKRVGQGSNLAGTIQVLKAGEEQSASNGTARFEVKPGAGMRVVGVG